jgi:hypothetical protein
MTVDYAARRPGLFAAGGKAEGLFGRRLADLDADVLVDSRDSAADRDR